MKFPSINLKVSESQESLHCGDKFLTDEQK